jgi:Xaa-Pro dipeptidase
MDVKLDFSIERSSRLARVHALMSDRALDALIVYSHTGYACNVLYLTGFVPILGDALLTVWPDRSGTLITAFGYDVPRACEVSGMTDVRTTQGGAASVVNVLEEGRFPSKGRLGVVGFKTLPLAQYQMVAKRWPDAEWVDMGNDFERLRLLKSAYEVELLRRAADMSFEGIKAIAQAARTGVSELELAAIADVAIRRAGSDRMAASSIVMTGPDIIPPIALPSERKLEEGDMIMVDVGGVYQGYCGDVARVMIVGKPGPAQQQAYETVLGAYQRALSLVRPGTSMKSIHKAANDYLIERGCGAMIHRVGHGVGLETSLEAPDLMRDDGVLEQGMTFSLEPGVYPKGLGAFKLEDCIVVTEHGYEILGSYPLDLRSV